MKAFRFIWLDGKEDILFGNSASQALNDAGHGAGALGALDSYKEEKELSASDKLIMDYRTETQIYNPTFINPMREALSNGLEVGESVFINFSRGFTMTYVKDNGIMAYFENVK